MTKEELAAKVTAYPDDENATGTELLCDLTRFIENGKQSEVTAFFGTLSHDQCMSLVDAFSEVNVLLFALLKTVAVQHYKVCPNRDRHRLDFN